MSDKSTVLTCTNRFIDRHLFLSWMFKIQFPHTNNDTYQRYINFNILDKISDWLFTFRFWVKWNHVCRLCCIYLILVYMFINIMLNWHFIKMLLGNDHLTWRGELWFFSKKIFWFPMLLKKIFWLWWRKKNNLIQSFCHIT